MALEGNINHKKRKKITEAFASFQVIQDETGKPVDFLFLEGSAPFETLTGLKWDQIRGKKVTEMIPESQEFIDSWIDGYESRLAKGKRVSFKYFNERFKHWIEIVAYGIEPGKIFAVLYDITDRFQIEEALRKREESFRLFIETAPIGVLISDQHQSPLYVNQKFTELFGYKAEEIPTIDHWWRVAYPDQKERERIKSIWGRAVERAIIHRAEIEPMEFGVHCKDGTIRHIEFRLSAFGDRSIVLFTDVTDRKRAEEQLRESEELFKTLAENSPIAIMIHQDDYYVYTNPAGERISGYSKEALYRMRFWEIIHPDYQSLVKSRGRSRQQGGSPPPRYDFKIITGSDEEKWVNISGSTTTYKGKPAGFVSVIDITERKQAVESLTFQLTFEKLVSDVSAALVSVSSEMLDESIGHILRLCGEFLNADRSYLFRFHDDGLTLENFDEWCAEGITSQIDRFAGFSTGKRPWWTRRLLENGLIIISDLDKMPAEAESEKKEFEIQKIKSLLEIAVVREGKLRRVLGFDSVKREKNWTEEQIALLRVVTEIVSNAISRQRAEKALKDSEARYRGILSTMEEGYYEVDLAGNFTFVNDSLCRIFGCSEEQLVNENYKILYKEPELFYKPFNRVYKTGRAEKAADLPLTTGDGREITVEASIALQWDEGENPVGFRGVVRDVTERKQAEEELQNANRRMEEIIEFLPDATFVIDNSGIVVAWNRAIEKLCGLSKEKIIGKGNYEYAIHLYGKRRPILIDLVSTSDDQEETSFYDQINREGKTLYGEAYVEKAYNGRGAYLWEAATVLYDREGKPVGAIETMRDITDRKLYEEKLEHLSLHDQLTGLYNRAYFDNEIDRLNNSRQYPITIIACDLDGLKLINDTLGHERGDRLLITCAVILKQVLRSSEVVARVGGDEFVVILPQTDLKDGEIIVERIKETIEDYNRKNSQLPLSISLGLAAAEEEDAKSLMDTYKEADDLMYRDKMHKGAGAKSEIIKSLMAALGERDFITEGHARRLEELCRKVGESICLSQKQLSDLALLAQVHDLGKVGIPDSILFKKGPLTEEEWVVMKTHPEKGHRIASASSDLSGIADLILQHHERWDGSGYPLGLAGENIPSECRILAIVDAFDAMTNDRPYRRAISVQESLAEIRKNAGTQFDPRLVEVFFNII